VAVETEDDARRGEFELHGTISALDTATKIFTLRGLTVDFGVQTVLFKDGTANNLANGAQIEVKGTLSSDGTRIIATIIEFEH